MSGVCSICSAVSQVSHVSAVSQELPEPLRSYYGSRTPPPYQLCKDCYEGAKSIINSTQKRLHNDGGQRVGKPISPKGFGNALKWIKEAKEINGRESFLRRVVAAYKNQTHDIELKPGNNEPSIHAHKAPLMANSTILKKMLKYDKCKAAPSNLEALTLAELNHDELQTLLEFFYNGTLPPEKLNKHLYSLSIAADKYEIPHLQKLCSLRMLESLNSVSALDILVVADACSDETLKRTALNFIIQNMQEELFSTKFEAFALQNPHLNLQITRACFKSNQKTMKSTVQRK